MDDLGLGFKCAPSSLKDSTPTEKHRLLH